MTEQEAIKRITIALATQSIPLPTTFQRQAEIAWNEMKAIAREDVPVTTNEHDARGLLLPPRDLHLL